MLPRAGSSFVFSCSGANSWLQHVGSSSLTRDRTPGPMHWKQGVLVTGPPGKSLLPFLTSHLLSSPLTPQQPHWSLCYSSNTKHSPFSGPAHLQVSAWSTPPRYPYDLPFTFSGSLLYLTCSLRFFLTTQHIWHTPALLMLITLLYSSL